jgi:BirA family biotin operon repressor/biotin-[acetyl-CoA-carboxylase] ligase
VLDWRRVAGLVAGQTIGRRVVYLESTTSTNDVARDLGNAGEPEGAVVVADAQTAGRGRAGKTPWLTPPGTSIAVSVLLRPPLAPEHLAQLALAAGVAAVDAIREATGVAAALKWPNDVMAGDRKLGGILAESSLRGTAVAFVVLGIGINGNVPAAALGPLPDAAMPATSLQDETGDAVSREAVLAALLRHLEQQYAAIADAGALREAYRARLSTLGRTVRIVGAERPVEGTAEDVAENGALVVRLASGARRVFAYGEVTVRV